MSEGRFHVAVLDTPSLGDRSYLVHDGERAVVIDPQRDIDRVVAVARREGVRITHVVETHMHNDYITGGLALARVTGAAYVVNAEDPVAFARLGVSDGDVVEIGPRLRLRVVATPGHTHTHLAYVADWDETPVGVFTGGSLLYAATGRPDLLGVDHTDVLAAAQWASVRRLAGELPDEAAVFPTHGFGSFCAATQAEGLDSTIGREKAVNPALVKDLHDYVEEMLAGLDAFPAYYAHMGPANHAGPLGPDLTPPRPANAAAVRQRIDAGEWVVDLRSRQAFAADHVAGSLSFGLDGSFATYLGWLIPWGTPLTLLGETPEQVAEAQRELVRIGIDRPAAAAVGSPAEWAGDQHRATLRRATFAELVVDAVGPDVVVLDVRRHLERAEAHLPGSLHIPFHELLERLEEVPRREVWVHCAAGYRAAAAASLLTRAGYRVVAVDDDFAQAAEAGLPLVRLERDAA
jgi:glyoxylase-like metal-dependent hydrolase (beta-lactamase superfamily II)/rhodanese-related sulfurtransferase